MSLIKEQDSLIDSQDASIRAKRSLAPSPELQLERVRSASSSYPAEGMVSTRIQSPVSGRGNRLSLSELSQFREANDRLSNLRTSSSSSSRPRSVSTANSTEQAIAEAAAVITAWQGEREPVASYPRFELPESDEDLLRATSPRRDRCSDDTGSSCRSNPPRYSDVSQHAYYRTVGIRSEGAREESQADSPSPLARPQTWPKGAKRKASQFSLGDITKPLTKRARHGIKKLASMAYRNGSRQFSKVRDKIRRHEEELRRQAILKAKSRKRKLWVDSDRITVWVRDTGHDGWWKEGVKKFHAPSWMHFETFGWWAGPTESR
ncbi:Fc.00g087550.m01.CDS01 [Cosmosporella sp. VM-42]